MEDFSAEYASPYGYEWRDIIRHVLSVGALTDRSAVDTIPGLCDAARAYFNVSPPPGKKIAQIELIASNNMLNLFRATCTQISIRASRTTFMPPVDGLRAAVEARWNAHTAHLANPCGQDGAIKDIYIIPVWHGTRRSPADIGKYGFVYFGKHDLLAGKFDKSKSTDCGYFGSGIYQTNSAEYAELYSNGTDLVLSLLVCRKPYMVISNLDWIAPAGSTGSTGSAASASSAASNRLGDAEPVGFIDTLKALFSSGERTSGELASSSVPMVVLNTGEKQIPADMVYLRGLGPNGIDDTAHYIPVVPTRHCPRWKEYWPCRPGEYPRWDEIVVFGTGQILPLCHVQLRDNNPSSRQMQFTRFIDRLMIVSRFSKYHGINTRTCQYIHKLVNSMETSEGQLVLMFLSAFYHGNVGSMGMILKQSAEIPRILGMNPDLYEKDVETVADIDVIQESGWDFTDSYDELSLKYMYLMRCFRDPIAVNKFNAPSVIYLCNEYPRIASELDDAGRTYATRAIEAGADATFYYMVEKFPALCMGYDHNGISTHAIAVKFGAYEFLCALRRLSSAMDYALMLTCGDQVSYYCTRHREIYHCGTMEDPCVFRSISLLERKLRSNPQVETGISCYDEHDSAMAILRQIILASDIRAIRDILLGPPPVFTPYWEIPSPPPLARPPTKCPRVRCPSQFWRRIIRFYLSPTGAVTHAQHVLFLAFGSKNIVLFEWVCQTWPELIMTQKWNRFGNTLAHEICNYVNHIEYPYDLGFGYRYRTLTCKDLILVRDFGNDGMNLETVNDDDDHYLRAIRSVFAIRPAVFNVRNSQGSTPVIYAMRQAMNLSVKLNSMRMIQMLQLIHELDPKLLINTYHRTEIEKIFRDIPEGISPPRMFFVSTYPHVYKNLHDPTH